MKNYYKITNGKLEITSSLIKLESPWTEYNIGEEPKELQDAINAEKQESKVINKIRETVQYLNDTDWYYVRKIETGKDVPDAIATKRAEARAFLNSQV